MKIVSCLKLEELKQSEIIRVDEDNPNNIQALFVKLLGTSKEVKLYSLPYATKQYYAQIGTCMYIGDNSDDEIFFLYVIEQEIKNNRLNIKNIYTEAIVPTGTILETFFRYDKNFQEKTLRERLMVNIDCIDIIVDKEYLKEKISEYLDRNDRVENLLDIFDEDKEKKETIEQIENDNSIIKMPHVIKRPPNERGGNTIPISIECYGKKYASINEVAREFGISQATLHSALKRGEKPEDVIERNIKKNQKAYKNTYEYLGQEMTLAELSELSGIKAGTIYQRIEVLKWTVEKAVETPAVTPSRR